MLCVAWMSLDIGKGFIGVLTIRVADGGVTLSWEVARWTTEEEEEEGGGWVGIAHWQRIPSVPTARWTNPCISLLEWPPRFCKSMRTRILVGTLNSFGRKLLRVI